jgi:hypothetical protein
MPYPQTPQILLMIRPASFGFNYETAASNGFQQSPDLTNDIRKRAEREFDAVVRVLGENQIEVIVIEDTKNPVKPDAVFPNNWISTHPDGLVITYPLLAANRRSERRTDVIDKLRNRFNVNEVWDISDSEKENQFLEGTGSIVFDHLNKIAYACRSPRTNEELLTKVCTKISYESIIFDAVDENQKPIYHTNVMMWIGEKVVVLCIDSIPGEDDQNKIIQKLSGTNHKIIAISYRQMNAFAGNMFEVLNKKGESFILLSRTAYESLIPGQLNEITRYSELLVVSIDTIEKHGGGGIRCMVAGIYLSEKSS